MEFTRKDNGSTVTVKVCGRLDNNTEGEFFDYFSSLYIDGEMPLVLDFGELEYISGAGIRQLLMLAKRLGEGRLSVINARESVMRTAKCCGVAEYLGFSDDRSRQDIMNMTFRELLAKRVRENPDKPFILHAGKSYGWKTVDEGVDVVASMLYREGITKYSHVGIFSRNSVNWVLTFLALRKLGAVAVLLNNRLTASELEEMIALGDIGYLCYDCLPEGFDCGELPSLCISPENDFIAPYAALKVHYDFGVIPVGSDDPAIMIFTSGSTGKPRGVILTESAMIRTYFCFGDVYRVTDDMVVCATLTMCHLLGLDVSLSQVMAANAAIAIPENYHISGILDCLRKECSGAPMVPPVLSGILASPDYTPGMLDNIRYVFFGGTDVSKKQMDEFLEMLPNADFDCCYGMSEDKLITMTTRGEIRRKGIGSSGPAAPDVEIVLSPDGEIITKGDYISVCYYNASPSEQFYDGDGWIHTGDIGSFDEDGSLHITGRIKDLINRGGEKILPSEVAAALAECEGIRQTAVVGIPDSFFGEVVTAAVVMKDGCVFDEQAVRARLAGRLASFKIPVCFRVFDSLPTLASGKPDIVTLRRLMAEYRESGRG